ncbi:hypothetical protein [Proteus mirabilis]|uniref:hypothetical protein n=1 Tax=Proteus mirabilis TaxID=584 RepID=UPI0034D3D654
MIGINAHEAFALSNSDEFDTFMWDTNSNKVKYVIPFIDYHKNLAYRENFQILMDFLSKEVPDIRDSFANSEYDRGLLDIDRVILNRTSKSVRIYFFSKAACDGYFYHEDSKLVTLLVLIRNLMRSFYLSEFENLHVDVYYR